MCSQIFCLSMYMCACCHESGIQFIFIFDSINVESIYLHPKAGADKRVREGPISKTKSSQRIETQYDISSENFNYVNVNVLGLKITISLRSLT